MWTDPKHLAQWWGPQGFTNPACDIDPRVGGRLYIVMRGPKDTPYDMDFPMSGTFQAVEPPSRLVFTAFAEDTAGNKQLESLTTVTFEAQGTKTKLTVHASAVGLVPIAPQMLAGMEDGWSQSLEKLSALIN